MAPSWLALKVVEIVVYLLKDINGTYSNQLWESFAGLFGSPLPILSDPSVVEMMRAAIVIAGAALPCVIGWQAIRLMVETSMGECHTTPSTLIRRSVYAGMTISGIGLYGWYYASMADLVHDGLVAWGVDISFLKVLFTSLGGGIAVLILTVVFLVTAGVVLIQRAILGMEFTLLMIIGAFLALSKVVEDNPVKWQLWKKEVIALCVTPILQLLILGLFARRLAGVDPSSYGRWVASFALLYLLWNTPKWARQYTYSTGVGHASGGFGVGLSRWAVTKFLLKK